MLKWFRNRYHIIYIVLALVSVLFVHRLFQLQLVDGENYRQISDDRLSRNMPVKAPRGEILDRYGRPLVTNRLGMSVAVQKVDNDKQKLNTTLQNLLALTDGSDKPFEDTLPITFEQPYAFTFSGDTPEEITQKELDWKKERSFKSGTTADGVVESYAKKYEFESLEPFQARRLAGVYYEMEKRNFSSSTPFVFASDLDIGLITQIKEQSDSFPCASVYTEPIREYVHGTTAAHILGRVGIINPEEYASLKDEGYGMNDYLGKQGAEKAFESYLKGTDGVNSIERTIDEGENKLIYSKDPVPGDSVLLTIDLDLQKTLEESLAREIQLISRGSGKGSDADSGAAAVIDVSTGEILAIASYPTFDPARFNEDYSELSQDPAKPMLNRALVGQYEPGSTYKPVTAIAALETGVLGANETIRTKGIFPYLGHDFTCLIYSRGGGNHGTINVSKALEVSCNYFFYDVAVRLGIDNLDNYARQFGFGEPTGIELAEEEARGVLAGPESREKNGGIWYPGDALQAAIGQSDNLFTPLQIANYVATLANGGTRYEAHLLKSVKSGSQNKIIEEKAPQVAAQIDIQPENWEAVVEGMLGASEFGTASGTFANYPIKTAAKTGTAQVSRGSDNSIFIGFAPFDKPQIAVAVVIEHGGGGSIIAPIAKDIYDEYFFSESEPQQAAQPVGELLP